MTSIEIKVQLDDILNKMKEYRGVPDGETIKYNGITYKSGAIMKELRKDYDFWKKEYQDALIEENKSNQIEFRYVKGYDI